jgi:hypothetical protein
MPDASMNQPPSLVKADDGSLTNESLANLIEWFLNYDERVAAIRHPDVDALFQWKQRDAEQFGEEVYPFPRAEDRLAIGIFQALAENNSEASLHEWISDLLNALQQAKETRNQVAGDYKFPVDKHLPPLEEAERLPSTVTQRLYLTACWLEILCTAEVRVLGWIYQQLYNKPFNP